MQEDIISTPPNNKINLTSHIVPITTSDKVAYFFVKILRFSADTFFGKRYGHRAVVLETVAAVPGLVAGIFILMRCLRRICDDNGWIRILLDEAENERMHLMTFIEIAQPNWFERIMILLAQVVFFNCFFLMYIISPKTAHRLVGYFEEEAVISYTSYLEEIDAGNHDNVKAPQIAIDYWKLQQSASLRDVVIAVRADEANHRDVNHGFANSLSK
jgi:ubiquinol oxidase